MLYNQIPRVLHPRHAIPYQRTLSSKTVFSTSNPLPATFLRGGTSKGIFLNRAHLPADRAQWPRIFLGIMGSPDPEYGRQLNGMGGGVSSLSKICVVGPLSKSSSSPASEGEKVDEDEDVDVEYTFVQVGIRDDTVDYSGNCGNLSSMIGAFAVDEGICAPRVRIRSPESDMDVGTVRAWNTNTNKRVDTTFPVVSVDGQYIPALDEPQSSIAGVPGKASTILLDFVSPAGARTGKLLPTGSPIDHLAMPAALQLRNPTFPASLVDATNPTVFVSLPHLRDALALAPDVAVDFSDKRTGELLEAMRRAGAEKMGLDPEAQAQPKIAAVSTPADGDGEADIVVHALSMGVLHKAVPMTVGLCLGVAANIRGTFPSEIVEARTTRRRDSADEEEGRLASKDLECQTDGLRDCRTRIRHSGGVVEVGALMENHQLRSARVVRTGRRLMKGVVWW